MIAIKSMLSISMSFFCLYAYFVDELDISSIDAPESYATYFLWN